MVETTNEGTEDGYQEEEAPEEQEPEETVADKLSELTSTAPRLAGPKRAARKARPPTKGKKPAIKTKMTTDDAKTGPTVNAAALMGGPPMLGGGGGESPDTASPAGPRKVPMGTMGGMNIAAMAAEQKGKLKTAQNSPDGTPAPARPSPPAGRKGPVPATPPAAPEANGAEEGGSTKSRLNLGGMLNKLKSKKKK